MTRVFLAQTNLDEWTDQGAVRLEGDTLSLVEEQRTLDLQPAVRFLQVADGSPDPHALVGKVKSLDVLKELGAEHYFDSVLYGETAYQVAEGFLGRLSPFAEAPFAEAPLSEAPLSEAPLSEAPLPEGAAAAGQGARGKEALPGSDEAKQLSDLFLTTVR